MLEDFPNLSHLGGGLFGGRCVSVMEAESETGQNIDRQAGRQASTTTDTITHSCLIWSASSRVGASTRTMGPSPCSRYGCGGFGCGGGKGGDSHRTHSATGEAATRKGARPHTGRAVVLGCVPSQCFHRRGGVSLARSKTQKGVGGGGWGKPRKGREEGLGGRTRGKPSHAACCLGLGLLLLLRLLLLLLLLLLRPDGDRDHTSAGCWAPAPRITIAAASPLIKRRDEAQREKSLHRARGPAAAAAPDARCAHEGPPPGGCCCCCCCCCCLRCCCCGRAADANSPPRRRTAAKDRPAHASSE